MVCKHPQIAVDVGRRTRIEILFHLFFFFESESVAQGRWKWQSHGNGIVIANRHCHSAS